VAAITAVGKVGRHARVNILAVTAITDWRGSRPHTWPISQSTTTPPAREDQADELPFFRRSIIPRAPTWKNGQQPSSRAYTLLTGYFRYL
jgi:hypothetical protein